MLCAQRKLHGKRFRVSHAENPVRPFVRPFVQTYKPRILPFSHLISVQLTFDFITKHTTRDWAGRLSGPLLWPAAVGATWALQPPFDSSTSWTFSGGLERVSLQQASRVLWVLIRLWNVRKGGWDPSSKAMTNLIELVIVAVFYWVIALVLVSSRQCMIDFRWRASRFYHPRAITCPNRLMGMCGYFWLCVCAYLFLPFSTKSPHFGGSGRRWPPCLANQNKSHPL